MELQRVSEIEDLITQNKLSASQVFTQMRQLVYREPPCHALCEKRAYEIEIRQLKSFMQKAFDEFNSTGHLSTKTCLKGAELV